ncbi:hypothetical protein NUSPORA_00966 [Nucleospora cyclopteri]
MTYYLVFLSIIYSSSAFQGYLMHDGQEPEYLTDKLNFDKSIKKATELKIIRNAKNYFVLVKPGKVLGINPNKKKKDDTLQLDWFTQKPDLYNDSNDMPLQEPSLLFKIKLQRDKSFFIESKGYPLAIDKNKDLKLMISKDANPTNYTLVTEDGTPVSIESEEDDKKDSKKKNDDQKSKKENSDKKDEEPEKSTKLHKTVPVNANDFVSFSDFNAAYKKIKNQLMNIEDKLDKLNLKIKEGENFPNKTVDYNEEKRSNKKRKKHRKNRSRTESSYQYNISEISSSSYEDKKYKKRKRNKSHKKIIIAETNCIPEKQTSNNILQNQTNDIHKQLENLTSILKAMPKTEPIQQVVPVPVFGPVPYMRHPH